MHLTLALQSAILCLFKHAKQDPLVLTKSVVDIQERLLRSEQGNLHPDLRSVQAKLDQALYHLHSRDVRIEELTMEIIQLLEERDSLQFRLSDALRRTAEPSKENLPKSPMQDETNTDKLSELHGGYKKDPVGQTEREARHVQQMQLYSEDTTANKEDSIVDYEITIKNQMEQLSDKDRIIVELQNEIRCLQSVSESTRYDFGDGEETLRSSIGFLEQERLRLEDLIQERLSEVANYEVEIEELRAAQSKPQKEDVATFLAMIEEQNAFPDGEQGKKVHELGKQVASQKAY
ncbi:hypothetical protein GE061_004159 [Apolygus lucorum]|uniref:Uncharacterized protein n=1 Tax=Apolygus lucorum TaxID=248454 RepID=A0A8S9WZW1_APOLU|nr:hypothetical protein GE061_004159 [Apolygus lucorum]